MFRKKLVGAWSILTVAILAAMWCVADEVKEASPLRLEKEISIPADSDGGALSADAEEQIQELSQIRDRLGADFDPLKDTLFDEPIILSKNSIASSPKLKQETKQKQEANLKQKGEDFQSALKQVVASSQEKSFPPETLTQGTSLPDHLDQELIWSLRQSGRLLEKKANDLEEIELYHEADDLRHLARQLRYQARKTSAKSR